MYLLLGLCIIFGIYDGIKKVNMSGSYSKFYKSDSNIIKFLINS